MFIAYRGHTDDMLCRLTYICVYTYMYIHAVVYVNTKDWRLVASCPPN